MQAFIHHWNNIITDSSCLNKATINAHRETLPYKYDEINNILYISIRADKLNESYESYNLRQIQNSIKKAMGIDVTCQYIKHEFKYDIDSTSLEQSIDFALNSLSYMTQFDFQNSEMIRSNEDYLIDTVRGKLAEYVFHKFYLNHEIIYTFEIDNKIYSSTIETDNGNDVEIIYNVNNNDKYFNNLKVDIKASKEISQWLLVEKKKTFSDVYVFIKIKFEDENKLTAGTINTSEITNEQYRKQLSQYLLTIFSGPYYGLVAGYAFYSDIIDPYTNKAWFPLKGSNGLPSVSEVPKLFIQDPLAMSEMIELYHRRVKKSIPKLKAEMNYGLPVNYLRNSLGEWNSLFKKIRAVSIPSNASIVDQQYRSFMTDRSDLAVQHRRLEIETLFNSSK